MAAAASSLKGQAQELVARDAVHAYLYQLTFGSSLQTILRFETMKQIKQEWVARSRLEWSKIPSALGITAEADHPFAAALPG